MARNSYAKAENHENTAFQKMTAGLRLAIEAAAEIACHREQASWNHVAMLLQKTLDTVNALWIKRDGSVAFDLGRTLNGSTEH